MCNKIECIWNGNGCICKNSSIQTVLKNKKNKCVLGEIIEVKDGSI
jgi:hypothetical protein